MIFLGLCCGDDFSGHLWDSLRNDGTFAAGLSEQVASFFCGTRWPFQICIEVLTKAKASYYIRLCIDFNFIAPMLLCLSPVVNLLKGKVKCKLLMHKLISS